MVAHWRALDGWGGCVSPRLVLADFAGLRETGPMESPRAFLPDFGALAHALEASWDDRTAYRGVVRPDNPAFGQCYPTARVVQWFYPEFEIARGEVWTGQGIERHFWNVRGNGDGDAEWVDLSWKQFPPGSTVCSFELLDRTALGDSAGTVARCALLLERVLARLESDTATALS